MDVSGFFFFSARGSPRCRESRGGGGDGFLLKIPTGGGSPGQGGGGSSGREGVCGEFLVGGAKYFLSGLKFLPRKWINMIPAAEIPCDAFVCGENVNIADVRFSCESWASVLDS